jgi:hypothetical protein
MLARNSRYLKEGCLLDPSGFKSLSMRWIEQTGIVASLESVDHS